MAEALVANYYELFDKKIENGTLVVIIISLCIMLVGLLSPHAGAYAKANIFESIQHQNIVTIDGENYEVVLKKL